MGETSVRLLHRHSHMFPGSATSSSRPQILQVLSSPQNQLIVHIRVEITNAFIVGKVHSLGPPSHRHPSCCSGQNLEAALTFCEMKDSCFFAKNCKKMAPNCKKLIKIDKIVKKTRKMQLICPRMHKGIPL